MDFRFLRIYLLGNLWQLLPEKHKEINRIIFYTSTLETTFWRFFLVVKGRLLMLKCAEEAAIFLKKYRTGRDRDHLG